MKNIFVNDDQRMEKRHHEDHHHHYKKKILFVLKRRNYGYGPSFGLINSVKFVCEALKQHKIDYKISIVTDANGIDKEVHDFKPNFVFLEALFVTPTKIIELLEKYKNKDTKWSIRIHSAVPFLQMEGIAITWLKEYFEISKVYKNFFISANSQKAIKELKLGANIDLLYAPNIYLLNEIKYNKKHQTHKEINIACLGAIRPLKNILEQACAAIGFANQNNLKLNFYVNSDRNEQNGINVLKNLEALFINTKHVLIKVPWMNHENLLKFLERIDLGLAVSFTESFCLQAGDYINMNIPIVTSKEITFVSRCYQAEPTDIEDIINKLNYAWEIKRLGFNNSNKRLLEKHNKIAIKAWLDLFRCKM